MTEEQKEYIRYLDEVIKMCRLSAGLAHDNAQYWNGKAKAYENAKNQFIQIFKIKEEGK